MIAVTVPPECQPSKATITRIRGAAKNAPSRWLRCKGKRPSHLASDTKGDG